jgi:hypothetical protein
VIHAFDDYPIHQSALPLLHPASESPNAYDRYFYNGFPVAGPDGDDLFFAVALGVYPNKGVMDAAFSVVRSGTQHNVRASRACPSDRTQTVVGPITVEVLEPMRVHRVVADGRHGLAADLTYTAISPVVEEPRFTHVRGTRTAMDYTRITQFGRWDGWIELDGERIGVGVAAGNDCVGVRDRSWGVRQIGERVPGPPSLPQFFWIWTPTVFADVCVHAAINHDGEGRPWHQSGAIVPVLAGGEPTLDPGRVQRAQTAEVDIAWQPGTRWAASPTIRLGVWNGDPAEVEYEPFRRFQMSGIGYLHPTWGHGCWVGADESTRDAIDLAGVDPADVTMIHVQALAVARWGDRTGVGVVEQLALGAHAPTGLTGITDGAGAG